MTLPVRGFQASGYRSLQRIAYPMSRLDVFVGANGAGKSNLYRALELLRAAAANTIGRDLGSEGLDRTMWAGARKGGGPPRIALAVDLSEPDRLEPSYRYEIEIGYPPPVSAAFALEPHVKTETLQYLGGRRPATLMSRDGPSVMVRGEDGRPADMDIDLLPSETVLGRLEDPSGYPALDQVRRTLLAWRFYHDLRTDSDSPLRRPCVAVATPDLASDGSDLAAVFATLAHIREDTRDLDVAIDGAFPGAELVVPPPGQMASFELRFPDFPQRVFQAAELSDGTLRFLGLAGALMAYRLPPFIALNEPEASLHPDLMEPLGRMIANAAARTQVWLVTHSERLAQVIQATGAGAVRTVVKRDGATTVEGLTLLGTFRDE
ncbi:MAG: AAA family ATPase [Alphaproteobacteria bacterium]|nr:AAA family ATPase [Alphaproteobacteria bacterium]MBU1512838.1 AAA family ATPase [Alphaproteobacteria bacterium]MBU2095726.1 AAA family ATPase [Alphaproteobacteria bacterium]MBU2153182.1 AAA family ATPase [Alphaproteobacteria bacterium]MBU2309006.1 AAA family ATPase [Alphaproteobacteria bacterium]